MEHPNLAGFSDLALSELAALVRAEQQRRAVDACDPEALIELGFQEGFKSDGLPRDPWIQGGMLICPGARLDKSATSHECGFARIDEAWVWEAEAKLHDVVRHVSGRNIQMRSVTLVAAYDGMSVDMIYARMRTGVHQLKQARSFSIEAGALRLIETRAGAVSFRDRPGSSGR